MKKWVSKPRYLSFRQLSKGGVYAVFLQRKTVKMKQAWAIGFTILERSKELIYDHYYNIISPLLGRRLTVAMTDTDSLILVIASNMSWDEIYEALSPIMDFSNFPTDHLRYDPSRMNLLEFWKDEMKGCELEAFAGTASKSYSLKVGEIGGMKKREDSKCKGVARGYRKTIPFEAYKKCVLSMAEHRVHQFTIQSKNHRIMTVGMDRKAFSTFDDKR